MGDGDNIHAAIAEALHTSAFTVHRTVRKGLEKRGIVIVPVVHDAVIENMSDGVIVPDAQDRIVDLNPAAQRIIGRPASEAIGQLAPRYYPGGLELVEPYRNVTKAHGEIVLGEGQTQRTFDLSISPLCEQRGSLTGRLAVLRGITGRKRVR